MQRAQSVIGAVLAGGGSRRMGRDKALLEIDGHSLAARAAGCLGRHLGEVVVVSARRGDHAGLGVREIADRLVQRGPLGGIHAALEHAGGRGVLALACDLPRAGAELIGFLLARALPLLAAESGTRVVAVELGGVVQPLCAVYAPECRALLERRLRAGQLRALDFAAAAGLATLPLTPELPFYRADLLTNVNDPAAARSAGVSPPGSGSRR